MCDICVKVKEELLKTINNETLLDDLIRAASDSNEYDNRGELNLLREQVLTRMK